MIFDRKINEKNIQQIRAVIAETLEDTLQNYEQKTVQGQSEQTCKLNELMEKNHKAVRNLSDTVEDFLDTLQEKSENTVALQAQQAQKNAEDRESKLLELLLLYREQIELSQLQFTINQNSQDSDEAATAWRQQYAMLNDKIKAESRLCTIEDIGMAGETIDYRFHEVLQAVKPERAEQAGTVAKVCSHGMLYQGTVIRKARVIAYRMETHEDKN